MIALDLHELIRLLTPTPLRHAVLLRSVLRAACSPVASLLSAQQSHEDNTAIHLANDGPRINQLIAALESYTEQGTVDVVDDAWTEPQALWLADDTATGHYQFSIFTDERHEASFQTVQPGSGSISGGDNNTPVGGGTSGGSTVNQGVTPAINPNVLRDEAYGLVPHSFTVLFRRPLTSGERDKAVAHLDMFKSLPTTYSIETWQTT